MASNLGERLQAQRVRNSNIELLRYVLMFLIILVHFNHPEGGGAFKYATPGSVSAFITKLTESIGIPAVNCFILITGYYGSKSDSVSIMKPAILIFSTIGYKIIFFLGGLIAGVYILSTKTIYHQVALGNWFVAIYCTLYVVSPYINLIIRKLSKKQFIHMMLLFSILFTVWPTIVNMTYGINEIEGISAISLKGDGAGYTLVNFVFMYLIGAYISKYYVPKKTAKTYFMLYVASVFVIFAFSLLTDKAWQYCNMIVIFEAITLFLAFLKLNIKDSKFINRIAKTSFGIYLVHTNPIMKTYFWDKFPIQKYILESALGTIIITIVSVLAMFLVCTLISYIFSLIGKPFMKLFEKIRFLHYRISAADTE